MLLLPPVFAFVIRLESGKTDIVVTVIRQRRLVSNPVLAKPCAFPYFVWIAGKTNRNRTFTANNITEDSIYKIVIITA